MTLSLDQTEVNGSPALLPVTLPPSPPPTPIYMISEHDMTFLFYFFRYQHDMHDVQSCTSLVCRNVNCQHFALVTGMKFVIQCHEYLLIIIRLHYIVFMNTSHIPSQEQFFLMFQLVFTCIISFLLLLLYA